MSDLHRPTVSVDDLDAVVYGLLAVAAAFVVGSIIDSLFGVFTSDGEVLTQQTVSFVAVHGFGFVSVSLAYLWLRNLDLSYLRVGKPDLTVVAWMVVATSALITVAYGLLELYSYFEVSPAEHRVEADAAANPELYLVLVVLSLVLIGPAEELVFRGVLQNAFAEATSTWVAVAAASLVFGLMHYGSVSGGWMEVAVFVFNAAALGLVLGAAYELSDNLLVPAAAHGIYNAMVFYIAFAAAV